MSSVGGAGEQRRGVPVGPEARGGRSRSGSLARTSASYASAAASTVAPAPVIECKRLGLDGREEHPPDHPFVRVGVADGDEALVADEHVRVRPVHATRRQRRGSPPRRSTPPESAIDGGSMLRDQVGERLRDVRPPRESRPANCHGVLQWSLSSGPNRASASGGPQLPAGRSTRAVRCAGTPRRAASRSATTAAPRRCG